MAFKMNLGSRTGFKAKINSPAGMLRGHSSPLNVTIDAATGNPCVPAGQPNPSGLPICGERRAIGEEREVGTEIIERDGQKFRVSTFEQDYETPDMIPGNPGLGNVVEQERPSGGGGPGACDLYEKGDNLGQDKEACRKYREHQVKIGEDPCYQYRAERKFCPNPETQSFSVEGNKCVCRENIPSSPADDSFTVLDETDTFTREELIPPTPPPPPPPGMGGLGVTGGSKTRGGKFKINLPTIDLSTIKPRDIVAQLPGFVRTRSGRCKAGCATNAPR